MPPATQASCPRTSPEGSAQVRALRIPSAWRVCRVTRHPVGTTDARGPGTLGSLQPSARSGLGLEVSRRAEGSRAVRALPASFP